MSNANTYTGATTVGGGTLNVTGNLLNTGTFTALTMNGSGITNFNEAAGSTQNMGALSFTSGDGTVQSTYGGSGTTTLTFASLAARSVGATENYVVSGGTNGSTNSINLTGAASAFINQGAFFGGGTSSANYAWMNGSGTYVRAINYGPDAGSSTTTGTTSIATVNYAQASGAVTAQNSVTLVTLNLSGTSTTSGQNDLTLSGTSTLTISGILRSGNAAGSSATISGGNGLAITTGDLVVRTDSVNDSLTINTAITGANANDNLVKSGAGTLILGTSAVNSAWGNVYINGGTLNISQESNLGGYTGAIPTISLTEVLCRLGRTTLSLVPIAISLSVP